MEESIKVIPESFSMAKWLTVKEYEKITRNVSRKKSAKIWREVNGDGNYISSIEVRDGELCAVIYTKARYGSAANPVREIICKPVIIGKDCFLKGEVKCDENEYWYGRNPLTSERGFSEPYIMKYDIVVTIMYSDMTKAGIYVDVMDNVLKVGDTVCFSTSHWAGLRIGTISKLNGCSAVILEENNYNNSCSVAYDQLVKVERKN